jgi:hypothetical protein
MKWLFVCYGALALAFAALLVLSRGAAACYGVLIMAVLGLWYLPVGTVINAAVLILMLLSPLRPF